MSLRISVITCVYNGAAFIDDYWRGIINLGNLVSEIIIVNDGSTDATKHKLDELNDKRLNIVHQNNKGLPASRNVGLNKTNSDYVIFLDIDDSLDSLSLKKISELLLKSNFDVVVANVKYVSHMPNKNTNILNVLRRFALPNETKISKKIYFNNFLVTPSCLVVSSAHAKNNPFRSELTIGEDWEFFTRVLDTSNLLVVKNTLVNYLIVDGSMSSESLKSSQKVRFLKESLLENYRDNFSSKTSQYSKHIEVIVALFELKRSNYSVTTSNAFRIHGALFFRSPRSIKYIFVSFFKMVLSKIL